MRVDGSRFSSHVRVEQGALELSNIGITDVAEPENLRLARDRVRAYYDGFTLRACPIGDRASFLADDEILQDLAVRLGEERYTPERADFDSVSKNNYTLRPISIPFIEDLIVAQAILNCIGPELDKGISPRSFAYRIKPDAPEFIVPRYGDWAHFRKVIQGGITDDRPSLLVSDITGFYENIVLTTLQRRLLELGVPDKIVDLVDLQFRAWQWRPSYTAHRERGLPQGGNPITNFYANIYLRAVDNCLAARSDITFERWVDDLVIHVQDELTARKVTRDLDAVLRDLGLSLNTAKTEFVPPKEIEQRYAFILMRRVGRHIDKAWHKWDEPKVAEERAALFAEARSSGNSSVFKRALTMLRLAQDGNHLVELRNCMVAKPDLTEKILKVFESTADVTSAVQYLLSFLQSAENIWPDQERLVWRTLRRMEIPSDLDREVRRLAKRHASCGELDELARTEAALSTIWFGSDLKDRTDIAGFATRGRAETPRFAKACVLAAGLTRSTQAQASVDWAVRQPNRAVIDFGIFLRRYVSDAEFAGKVLSSIKTRKRLYKAGKQSGIDVEDILLLAHGSRSDIGQVKDLVQEHARSLVSEVADDRTNGLLDEIMKATTT